MQCSCRDCVGFASGVIEASKKKYQGKGDDPKVCDKGIVTQAKGAVNLLAVYNAELTLLQGGEHIRALKLSEKKSAPLRCYAACCGTPFAAPDGICFLYPALLEPNPDKTEDQVDFAPFSPTNNIFIDSAPQGSALPPEGCQATNGVPPGLMFRFLGKLATCPFRSRTEDAFVNTASKIEHTIGIESITLEE